MKVALRGLIVLAAAAVLTQSGAAAQAHAQHAARPGAAIFWSPRVGLLGVGYCVPVTSSCNGGAVQRTTDGGRTYHVVLRTSDPIVQLKTVGPRGAIATPSGGHAWQTLDGGRTWKPFEFRPFFWATPRIAIRFDSHLEKSGTNLALHVTHDGGKTWDRRPDPCNHAVTYNAYADLVTANLWWIVCVGAPAGGTADKAIFSTRDSGKTWKTGAANLGPPNVRIHGGVGLYGAPDGLAFARNGFGILTEIHGTLYVTRDGGVRFEAERKIAQRDRDMGVGAAAFANGVGYALLTEGFQGFSAHLVETTDFGRTWRVVHRWSA